MDNQDNYFYASGFLSLSIFFIFIFSFFLFLFNKTETKTYALNKDNFVSISLDSVPSKTKPSKQKTQKTKSEPTPPAPDKSVESKPTPPKPAQKVESKPTPQKPTETTETVDVNDLFSNVATKKVIQKESKPTDSKRISQIQQQIKGAESNNVKSVSKSQSKSQEADSQKDSPSASTASEVNEYIAKIQAIIYQNYHVPANTHGNSVKVVVELNAFGKLIDFRILNYSNNSELNAEADKIKDRLRNIVFPMNPDKKSFRTIVILESQE